jgi:hypothetical protein
VNEENPWVTAALRSSESASTADSVETNLILEERRASTAVATTATPTRVSGPQAGVDAPRPGQGLPTRLVSGTSTLWVIGTHGGAGESSIAALVDDWSSANRSWPSQLDADSARCVLVARSNAHGLRCAQNALRQWASGEVEARVDLLGLIIVADAPGRLPRPLRDLVAHVAGGAPRTWQFSWVEQWRTGDAVDLSDLPRSARQVVDDLRSRTTPAPHPQTHPQL